MQAMLLAAGAGTRLKPVTDRVPKCLAPIRGRPLLEIWLDRLTQAGVSRILVNLHSHADLVRDFIVASPWRVRVDTVFEPELLGTGGTLLANRAYFTESPILVAHADNLTIFDLDAFAARHAARPTGVEITMMTFHTPTPETCGIVECDERGVVRGFHEKVKNPPGRRANAAVYLIEPTVLDDLATLGGPFIDLSTQLLPRYVGRMQTFHNTDYHRDIGNVDSLRAAQAEFPVTSVASANAAWQKALSRDGGALRRTILEQVGAEALGPTRARPARIGLDFDNTIVSYDRLFHRLALENGWIDASVPVHKRSVRDAMRRLDGGNDLWTELQGIVYGQRMAEADLAPGALEFIGECRRLRIPVSIISHKSVYPAKGPRLDLREAARAWIESRGIIGPGMLDATDVVFLGTIEEKLAEVERRGCSHFVDDLVEILDHPKFPRSVTRVLYDALGESQGVAAEIRVCRSWVEVERLLLINT